jgi:hypothetical protein
MTRIKNESGVKPIYTSDVQNAENVRSLPDADKDLSNRNSLTTNNQEAKKKELDSPEHLSSKLSENNLQAKARATELNSQLNTQDTDQPKTANATPLFDNTPFDELISIFKGQPNASAFQPKVNSIELENTMVSNAKDKRADNDK